MWKASRLANAVNSDAVALHFLRKAVTTQSQFPGDLRLVAPVLLDGPCQDRFFQGLDHFLQGAGSLKTKIVGK